MAIKDIDELNEKYIEGNTYRAFLFTPANVFAGELDLIAPRLSLKKDGFDLLDFSLSAKLFDLNELTLADNPFIDYTLDGYYIVMEFGDLTSNDFDERRFVIKNRNSNLEDDAASFSYTAISSEFELQKLPIINWPGIEVEEYKDISNVVESIENSLIPTLLDGSEIGYNPIQLRHTPKDEKIFVSRVHTVYKIEIPLFETSVGVNELNKMGANEYYYDRQNDQIITWLPAHLNLPTSPAGEVDFNDPVDSYQFFIYYQTTDEINTDEEDQNTDIIEDKFEKAYFYNTDGLTINQILEDLFQILSTEESNLRFFTQWTYDREASIESSEIRSDINFSNTTVYDMLKSLEENYQLYIEFNTMSREVILRERFSGQNRGLRFEYGKYLNGVSQEYNTDELITYMQGQDANNIGFADVSWSGDNYVENYDYYLDGVTWEPQEDNADGILTGVSRWITADLARVLGKIKYYQDFYEAEVWGDENANPQKKGIANIRFELQEQLNEIDFQIIEIEKEIQIKEAIITNYTNEEPSQKLILDNGVKRNPANITSEEIVSGVRFDVDLDILANKANNTVPATRNINDTTPVTFRSFRLIGSDFFKVISIGGIEREITTKDLITNIRVEFFNGSNPAEKVKTVYLTAEDTNKEIALNGSITATSFEIRLSVEGISLKVNFKEDQSFEIKSLSVFEEDSTETIYTWDTYDQYLNSLILDLQARKNSLEIEQHLIKNGTVIDFNSTNVINENNIYDATVDNPNAIGIGQIELRLDYIRTFTAVNHESLDTNVLNELKLIRKGAVYSNNDIRNSKTLFIAARDELEEKIYPMITVDISSVSLLQTYEAFEDWKKFKIGEKVDIFVPQLRINIEAEIQELDFDFQNYQTSLKISTVRNYDKTFGRIFSNTFLLANKTSRNEVKTLLKPNQETRKIVDKYGRALESMAEKPDLEVGFEGLDSIEEASNIRNIFQGPSVKGNNNIQFDVISLKAKFIDLATDTLVDEIPVYYDSQKTRGAAQITNGGIYIKDPDGEVRIKMNSADGLVGYKTESGVITESFKIDLDGNATFSGDLGAAGGTFSGNLQAAGGTFGNVSIAENGELSIGNGNITINNAGIIAVDDNDNQTLLISSTDGSIFIKGTIQEGTVFESILTRQINVTGGTRIVNYDADDTLPDGEDANTIMGTFTAQVFANGIDVSNDANTLYSWSVEGLLDVTGVTTNAKAFSPKIATTYSNQPTQIILNVTYNDNIVIQEIIPINITKDGIQGINGFNQAQIYLYKRVSGTAPANVGTIAGGYTFSTATAVLTTNSDTWSLTIPGGSDPLYVSIGTVKSQADTVNFTQTIFSGPVKLVEDGADGANGLNVATVYVYLRADTLPTTKPTGDTTFTFSTGGISFTNANGWSAEIPTTGGANLWVRIATAASSGETDIIADTEWSAVGLIAPKGDDGVDAKVVNLTASTQAIVLNPDATINGAQSVVFDTETQGAIGATLFTFSPDVSANFTLATKTLTFADNATQSFPITVTFGHETTQDTLTIIGVKPGADGEDGDDSVNAFLTNESHIVQADSAGVVLSGEFTLATTDIVIFVGITDDSANWTVTRTPSSGITLTTGNVFPITAMTVNTGTVTITASKSGFSNVVKTFTITKSRQGVQGADGANGADGADGADGTNGIDGADGPGVVFRGLFDSSVAYFHTASRRDIVQNGVGGSYFITNNLFKNGLTTWGSPTTSDWEAFGQEFSSVATDILLAQNATITRGLVIGELSPTDSAFIRSTGKTALSTGAGFYLNDNGSFNFGDSHGSNIDWNGSALNIKGDLKIEQPYYSYSAASNGEVKATNLSTNLSPYSEDHETYFPITLTTDTINTGQTTNEWQYLLVYTGSSIPWDGNTLPDPNGFDTGAVILWLVDDSYYQVVEVSGVTTIDLVVKGSNQSSGTTYTVPLLLEVDNGESYYRSRGHNIAHKLTTVNGVDVYFYSIFSTNGYIEAADLTPKVIIVSATEEDKISNLFDLVLASSGVGTVVSSINGLTGDVEIATGGTSSGVVRTVTGTNSAELVRGNMGDNDQARILVGATASNAGFLEIATADDGTEPIHVRQYTGVFTTLTRTATLLDGSGNTSFPGTVTAPTFSGALTGNATTATSATTASSATIVNGTSGQITSKDDRIIEPISITTNRMQFGFTSFHNDNTSPFADYLHLRSYSDSSGGLDNLVMFRKDVIGMRIYQQAHASTSAYSSFKDVAFTDHTHPNATTSASGFVRLGVAAAAAAVNTATTTTGRFYHIGATTDGNLYVNVPWENTEYSNFVGASIGQGGSSGLVPGPAAGDINKFLKGDGTWANTPDIYTHPTHPGDDINIDTGPLTGATVISDLDFNITTNTEGHVTDANATIATRNLTAANLGALATTGGTLSDNLTISKAMSNGTTAFTSPHLILAATNTIDNTGFVGMTLNTSTAANYGWSYGAQRTSGGNGDLIWRNHDSSTSGLERMRLYDSGNLDVAGTVKATNVTVGTNNVWHAGNLEFELDGTTMNIITS